MHRPAVAAARLQGCGVVPELADPPLRNMSVGIAPVQPGCLQLPLLTLAPTFVKNDAQMYRLHLSPPRGGGSGTGRYWVGMTPPGLELITLQPKLKPSYVPTHVYRPHQAAAGLQGLGSGTGRHCSEEH